MQLRRRDVERWMSHRRLPEALRRFARFTFYIVTYHDNKWLIEQDFT